MKSRKEIQKQSFASFPEKQPFADFPENTCVGVPFRYSSRPEGYFIKNRLQHKCFSVKFAKYLRTTFFIEHLRWLLLGTISRNHC